MLYRFVKSILFSIGINTIYQLTGRLVTAISALVVTRLIIHKLGLQGYGDFQIVITYVTIFWMLTDFGLNALVVREMAERPNEIEKLFGGLLTLRSFLGLALIVVSSIVLIFMPYDSEIKLAILIGQFTILSHSIRGSCNGIFQLNLKYLFQAIAETIGAFLYLFLVVIILNYWSNQIVVGITIGFLITQIAITIITIIFAQKLVTVRISKDIVFLKKLFILTIPFGLSLLFSLGNFKVDALLLSVLKSPQITNSAAVGIYNAAYKFFEFGLLIPTLFMNATYPVMIKQFKQSQNQFLKTGFSVGLLLLGISIIGLIIGILLAPSLIKLIAGEYDFSASVTVLRILLLELPLFYLSSLLMWILLVLKGQRQLIVVYAVAMVVNFTLNWIFIPQFSYYAAAISTGISEFIIIVLLAFFIKLQWSKGRYTA